MSDGKGTPPQHVHDLESQKSLTTITLTPEQFETLLLQHGAGASNTTQKFGNSIPLGVTCFLFAHLPLSMDLLGFQGATPASPLANLGAFYVLAGLGLWISAIMAWAVGNTFVLVAFGTYGGFWASFGIFIQPSFGVAAGFAPPNVTDTTVAGVASIAAGEATRPYNTGIGLYFVTWAIVSALYTVAALRINVPFFLAFGALVFAFSFLATAYFHLGVGHVETALKQLKVAGGFAMITGLAGLWIDISLVLEAVDFPIKVPLLDLSGLRFMQPRKDRVE